MDRFTLLAILAFSCGTSLAYQTPTAECQVYDDQQKSSCAESYEQIDYFECETMRKCCWDDSRTSASVPICYRAKTVEFTETPAPAPSNPFSQQAGNQQPAYNPQAASNPTGGSSSNINNLLQSLNLPTNAPYNPAQGQGALGTNVAAPNIVPQAADKDKVLFNVGTQCQIANSIVNQEVRVPLLEKLGCTGNEPVVSQEKANAAVQNLLGSLVPGISGTPQQQQQQQQQQSVGSLLPNYGGQQIVPNIQQPNPQTQSNQAICDLLKNAGASLQRQFGCLSTNNNLLGLLGGNVPSGLPGLPSLLSLIGGSSNEVNEVKEGAINPDLIPFDVLKACVAIADDAPTCRTGYSTNIYSSTECFNAGCVYWDFKCFKCNKVPGYAYINQDNADTCAVPTDDRKECDGYKSFQYTTILLSGQQQQQQFGGFNPNPFGGFNPNPFGSSNANNFGGLGTASLSSPNTGSNNLLQSALGGNNLNLLSLLRSDSSSTSNTQPQTNTNPIAGRARDAPTARQLNINPLLLSGLTGGSSSNSLLSLLYGGDSGGPRVSDEIVRLLRSTCENKQCCWKKGGYFGGECYSKGTTFPNCLPSPDSGECGKSPANTFTRIVGGSNVGSNNDRPWMALIKFAGSSSVRCGGALICSQWIVTTASCLQKVKHATDSLLYVPNLSPDSLEVYVGTTDPVNPQITGTRVAIEKIVVHPSFSFRQSYNDIALLQIRTITFSNNKRPACMPSVSSNGPSTDSVIYFNAYGDDGSSPQSVLKELPFTVKSDSHCRNQYPLPLSGVFCAESAANTDSCYGDGGAPAVQYDSGKDVFTIVGLNFGGSDNCDGTKPSLFTKISTFMSWIAKTTYGCCAIPGSRRG